MLLPLMPIEETGETRVRTDCLNFDVSLCIQIKKQNSIRAVFLKLFLPQHPFLSRLSSPAPPTIG